MPLFNQQSRLSLRQLLELTRERVSGLLESSSCIAAHSESEDYNLSSHLSLLVSIMIHPPTTYHHDLRLRRYCLISYQVPLSQPPTINEPLVFSFLNDHTLKSRHQATQKWNESLVNSEGQNSCVKSDKLNAHWANWYNAIICGLQ